LRITIDLHPRFEDAVDLLLTGFVGASDVPARCDVHLTLDLGQLDRHEPQAAHFVREGSVLVGRCEAWHARLGASSDRVSAHFGIRDSRHLSPHLSEAWDHAVASAAVASALRVTLAFAAPLVDGLLAHAAAAVSPAGNAWVFAGPSGEGKTTMTRRLANWRALADDAVLVFATAAGWRVTGTPLQGSERLPRRAESFPIAGLAFLKKAPILDLARVSLAPAFAALLSRLIWFFAPDQRLASRAHELVSSVPCWCLQSALSHDVAALLEARLPSVAASEAAHPW